jgi:hypothetical protein
VIRYVRRAAAAVVGAVAAAVLAGCSITATPGQEPDYLTPASVDDLLSGCVDLRDGYPDAAKYAGDGPHTIAIFAKNLVSDASLNGTGSQPKYEPANSNTSDGLLATPGSPRDVALLACGSSLPGLQQLNVCTYQSMIGIGGRPLEVPLYSQLYTFRVYELRTGRLVDTLQLESQMKLPDASCPGVLEGGTKVFAKAQPFELDDLFKDIVTAPAT